ncbi:MAG TPA: YciI family protein [Candidatus Acidoferrum sp.]|nr:YciI family protein [Candidatus Acidoferrum sp.]
MQFVVTAMDYTDADALERRMTQREAHLAGVRKLIAEGRFVSGGAILDDAGKMIGSSLHMDFPDRAALEQALQSDPYVAGKVWERIEIRTVRLVPLK